MRVLLQGVILNRGKATVKDPTTVISVTEVNETVVAACGGQVGNAASALHTVVRSFDAALPPLRLTSDHKILRRRVMHHNRRRTLFGLEQESRRETYADILFRLKKSEQFRLIFQVWACGVTE